MLIASRPIAIRALEQSIPDNFTVMTAAAGELHSYVQANVIQQSSGSQTPELQGDVDRVLVRFQ